MKVNHKEQVLGKRMSSRARKPNQIEDIGYEHKPPKNFKDGGRASSKNIHDKNDL